MTKISINQRDCTGCNFCESCVPGIFLVDQTTFKSKIKKDGNLVDSASFELSEEQKRQVKEAVEGCPVCAIELSE
jgi:ferredoxin